MGLSAERPRNRGANESESQKASSIGLARDILGSYWYDQATRCSKLIIPDDVSYADVMKALNVAFVEKKRGSGSNLFSDNIISPITINSLANKEGNAQPLQRNDSGQREINITVIESSKLITDSPEFIDVQKWQEETLPTLGFDVPDSRQLLIIAAAHYYTSGEDLFQGALVFGQNPSPDIRHMPVTMDGRWGYWVGYAVDMDERKDEVVFLAGTPRAQ